MKTILKYSYAFLWLFVIPVIIGLGTGDLLLRIYHNSNEHLLAGVVVCFFSGAVVTWIPMTFLIDGAEVGREREHSQLFHSTLFLGIAGCAAPILSGFEQGLDTAITVLLIFSAFVTKEYR